MKKLIMALTLVLSLAIVGCSSEPEVKDIPVADIKSAINNEQFLPAQPVAEMTTDQHPILSDLQDKISEGFILEAMMSTNLQDVFVIKTNSNEDVEAFINLFEDYRTNNVDFKMFADGYGSERNIDIAANSIIGSHGNYVYFIAVTDSAAVEAEILNMIQ